MKTAFHLFLNVCLIVAATVSGTVATQGAPTNSPAATRPPEIASAPKSVYNVPASPKEGRDPFFPNRLSNYSAPTPAGPKSTPPLEALTLNGISGAAGRRFAMINRRTFAEGEEQEVPTVTGRVQVRCIEIKENSVIVEVDGERGELRLRSGI